MASFSLTQLPWKAQLAIFVLLSIAGAGAFYYFYEMPHQAEIAASRRELTSIRDRMNKGLSTARSLGEFRKEVDDLKLRLDSLRPILPEEKDAADLLRNIQTLATQSDLTIRGFKPQPIATKEMHAEWPISLQLEGTYHNLGMFLDRVSKFPRIINVGKLDIKAKQDPDPNASIEVACTATTFVLLNTPVETKKKGAPAKAAPKKTE